MLASLRSRLCFRIGVALILLFVASAPAKAAPSGVEQSAPSDAEQAFRALGCGDRTARALDGSLDYFFPIPLGQAPQAGSQITLSFSHSPLLLADRSTIQSNMSLLTRRLNGASARSKLTNRNYR